MPRCPSDGRVTEGYGPRAVRPTPTSPLFHYGEDSVGYGNRFPVDGVIISAAYVGSYGNRVVIRQANDSSIHWWLCHNASLPNTYGTWGKEGDLAAPMGATGNVTGVHVHTERRVNATSPGSGNHTNPRSVYSAPAGGGTTTPIPNEPTKARKQMALLLGRPSDKPDQYDRPPIMLDMGKIRVVPEAHFDLMKGCVGQVITVLNAAQYDIIKANYIQVTATDTGQQQVDAESIAQTVIDYLNDKGVQVDTGNLAEELSTKIDVKLADDFAAIREREYEVVPKE